MITEIKFPDNEALSIDLETLKASADYKRSSKFPVSHHQVIANIDELLGKHEHRLDELYISKSGVQYPTQRQVDITNYLESIYDTKGVIINNMIARINLSPDTDEDNNQSIAISYNKRGIQIAMGVNIKICSNLCIFGDNVLKNYGNGGINFEKMLDLVQLYIINLKEHRKRDLHVLQTMKSIYIQNPQKEMDEIVGNLHRLVEMNKQDSRVVAPLNHSEINQLQRTFMEFETPNPTLYDVYQSATFITSRQNTIEFRIDNTYAIGQYFIDRYGLGRDFTVNETEYVDEHSVSPVINDLKDKEDDLAWLDSNDVSYDPTGDDYAKHVSDILSDENTELLVNEPVSYETTEEPSTTSLTNVAINIPEMNPQAWKAMAEKGTYQSGQELNEETGTMPDIKEVLKDVEKVTAPGLSTPIYTMDLDQKWNQQWTVETIEAVENDDTLDKGEDDDSIKII